MQYLSNTIDTKRNLGDRATRILLFDEDPGVRRLMSRELASAGYHVQACPISEDTLEDMARQDCDLLMMDIDAPASAGLNLIRVVRRQSSVPILALSFHSDEEVLVQALQAGADDYIQKPFRLRELLARTMNALRRRALEQGKPVVVITDALEIDLLHRRVRLHGCAVRLAAKPYQVLQVLAESAGNVLTHEQLLDVVWKSRARTRIDYLRIAIRELRTKLESNPANPRYILTERGIGYRLHVGPDQPGTPPSEWSPANSVCEN